MEVTLSHKEPTLKAVNPYLKKEKKECNPSVNIVASLNKTIQKLALIREEMVKCASIEEQIKLVSDLNMDEILNLRKLLEKTYEKNYGNNTKDAIEVLETKYTEKELDDIHSVRGAIPAITTLASRDSFEGIETPLHCIVYLWKNFEIYADLYQMKVSLKELWDRKDNLDKLSQPTFMGQMEILTGQYKDVIEQMAQSLPSILTCHQNIAKLTKLSDNVEKMLEVLDNLPLLETIEQELTELKKITDNIDDIMLVRQYLHNINTLAQNIDKINGGGNTGGGTTPTPNPTPTPTPPKTEVDTTLTADKNNLSLKINQSEVITFTSNATSINITANPTSNVNIQKNGLKATITPLVAGNTTLTISAKANDDTNHTYRTKTITINVSADKIEEETTLTQNASNTTLELNNRPRNPYTIDYTSNADAVNVTANPADKVNISLNNKIATITPLLDGQVSITATATASETDTHIYTEKSITQDLTINPIKPYQRLYAGDFDLMNPSGSKTDNLDAYTITGGPIGQFSGTSCPSQLKACLLLRQNNLDTYRGLIFQADNQYTLTSGYYNPSDVKYYMYGIFGMNLAIAKIDQESNTFMLSPTPSNTYSLNTNSLVYVRFIKLSDTQERLRITIIHPDNSIESGGTKDLQYTLKEGITPILSISQGWQGGNQTIIARGVVGIRADNTEGIQQDVSTDFAALLRQKWQEALDADN